MITSGKRIAAAAAAGGVTVCGIAGVALMASSGAGMESAAAGDDRSGAASSKLSQGIPQPPNGERSNRALPAVPEERPADDQPAHREEDTETHTAKGDKGPPAKAVPQPHEKTAQEHVRQENSRPQEKPQISGPPGPKDHVSGVPNGVAQSKSVTYTKRTPNHNLLTQHNDHDRYVGFRDINDKFNLPPIYNPRDTFHLKASRCSLSFFPGAKLPEIESIADLNVTDANFDAREKLAPYRTAEHPWGPTVGCSIMNLQQRNHLFLLKSEFTIKNNKVGMVLWTGLKNTSSFDYPTALNLHFVQYLLLLEKDGKEWRIKAGFGWGTEDIEQRPHVGTLTVRFPNGKAVEIYSQNTVPTTTTTHGYAGMWSETDDPKGAPALNISSIPHHVNVNYSLWWSYKDMTLESNHMIGYNMNGDYIQTFFYEPQGAAEKWKWKRIKHKGSRIRLDIVSQIEDWYRPFRRTRTGWAGQQQLGPRTGIWTDMETYCNALRENTLTEDQKRENPCLISN